MRPHNILGKTQEASEAEEHHAALCTCTGSRNLAGAAALSITSTTHLQLWKSMPGRRTLLYVLARAALPKALQETPLQGLAACAAAALGRHRALHRRGRSRQSVTGSHHRVQRIKAAGPAAVQPLTRAWRGPRALGRTHTLLGVRRPNQAACSRRARSATSVVRTPSRFLLLKGPQYESLRTGTAHSSVRETVQQSTSV